MSTFDDADVVVIGRVQGPYGVRGWVHVASYTDPLDNLLAYQPVWRLQSDGRWLTARCQAARAHGKSYVARFGDCEDRNAAAALRGRLIGVPANELPEPAAGEYYWRDLIGMQVVDRSGRSFGQVSELMETGANDVLVVSSAGGTEQQLIPFSEQHVIEVDLKRRRLTVEWDER